jgi:hypothetical protein
MRKASGGDATTSTKQFSRRRIAMDRVTHVIAKPGCFISGRTAIATKLK